ncbi:MAG: hypothetical protein NZ703_15510 [Gemmataceae bacterium]|nr:hypothetical protein [Gemmataceae bacterium]
MIQAARGIEPATLVQVEPGEGAAGECISVSVEDCHLAERIVNVTFDDVA